MNISLDFTSYSFIIACALFVALYYTVPMGFQWVLLLFASISIYLVTSPAATVFLLITMTATYISGILIGKPKGKAGKTLSMLIPLLIDTGLLIYAKYTGFLYDIFCQITSKVSEGKAFYVIVPMGISFYTFQSLAYILDVYKGKTSSSPICSFSWS